VSYLLFAYKNVIFSAYQREDIISKVYSILLIIGYSVQILILYLFRNYYLYYVIVPFVSIANNCMISYLSKRYYPNLKPSGKVPEQVLKDIREKVSGVVISKFCGLTRNTFDSIIISAFLGLTTVAIYSNYYYILSNVASVIVILVTSMRAGIGNSVAIDSVEKNFNDFKKFTFMYFWIASWCAICLLCLYQPFMRLWAGEDNTFPFYIVILLCIYFLGQSMGDIPNAYSGAVGLWWENRYRTIAESICNLILNIGLGYFFGVFGIILATVITIFVFSFFSQSKILFQCYFGSYDFKSYIITHIKYVCITALVATITLGICSRISLGNLGDLILRGVVCILLPNLLFFVIYKNDANFVNAKNFMMKFVK
jgi:O-antigen/teichoic acid export membrane protein